MYENITFESILERMLSRIPSDMDKREGSLIYDALAPCAVELQLMYIELDNILMETFADTASREYLVLRASERGISPNSATKAILKGEFDVEVGIGKRFRCEGLIYVVLSHIEGYIYQLQCETAGQVGNRNFGDLKPIDFIEGLGTAKLTELIIPAEDEEDTESLRTRYFNSFEKKAFVGNVTDYLEKTNAIEGVGAVKVTPVWQGGGTVKLTVLDSMYNKASDVLLCLVQETMDPTMDGKGMGIAPVGHIVTVDTVSEVLVDIQTTITFDTGYSFETMESSINKVLEEYLQEERSKWGEQSYLIIRIAYIESKILGLKGVLDIGNTKLNGVGENLVLGIFEIPVLGGVVNGE